MNKAETKSFKKFPSRRLSLLLAINNGVYVLLGLEKKESVVRMCAYAWVTPGRLYRRHVIALAHARRSDLAPHPRTN